MFANHVYYASTTTEKSNVNMFRPQKKPVKEEVDNSADAALERAVRSRKRENKNLKRLAVPNRQRPSDNALQANNVRFKGHRLSKTISMPCLGHPAFVGHFLMFLALFHVFGPPLA